MRNQEDVFFNANYVHYLIKYEYTLGNEYSKKNDIIFTKIDENLAIMTIPQEYNGLTIAKFMPFISYIHPQALYTLEDISPIEAADINSVQGINSPLNLSGKNVTVAIIDTGIDYTNPIFTNSKGESRIKLIWDQSLKKKEKNNEVDNFTPFGEVFFNDEINKAIKLKSEGGDPYSIVPSKDIIGHGTQMASLIGGRYEKNTNLQSVVPECNFIIIKLMEEYSLKNKYNIKTPIFNISVIIAALNFLYKYSLIENIPMVIHLPVGTNSGNHRGSGIVEEFINNISNGIGIVVVTGTGNEGNKSGHTSGRIYIDDEYKDVQLYIAPNQKVLQLEIWVRKPNILNVSIISPSGESTGIINASILEEQSYNSIYEKTKIEVNYFIPESFSGDELILIKMIDIQPGTWVFRLYGRQLLDGYFDAWIPQSGIALEETKFISPDPYGTVTSPGSSSNIITVANYNQNNNNLVNSSGMSFLNDLIYKIDLAAGGVDVLTVNNLGDIKAISGTSVSSAIVAGACAMLMQWGIVEGNDKGMYSRKIKTYLTRGTSKRSGDIYPNEEWGYGMLNLTEIFRNTI